MFYTVYKVINLLNNRYYIGVHKTKNPNDKYYGSGIIIKDAINKYGKENFTKEILFIFDNSSDAYLKEKELVNEESLKDPLIYNIQIGGIPTIEWTEERKLNHSKNYSGINSPMFGKKYTEEHKQKISQGNIGRKHSKETIEKIVTTRKNNNKPNTRKGIPLTIEDKLKKSIAALNKAKVTCPVCNKTIDPGNAKQWHFEKCKGIKEPKISLLPIKICPFCYKKGRGNTMYKHHFQKCKKRIPVILID